MGFSEEVAKYEGSSGEAMMKYGTISNESGQMLARELFARELQARELLAREMGSQADSQAGESSRRKHVRQRSSSNRSFVKPSSNISLDGSMMSARSRWEPEPVRQRQQESSSLPAEFLFFKFEQMAARWVDQKKTSTAGLSWEAYRPRVASRPPRTITTTKTIPTSTEDNNVPRFMRNTTTSASKKSPPPSAASSFVEQGDKPQQQLPRQTSKQRAATPTKVTKATTGANNKGSSEKRNNSTGRRRPSPSPVRNRSSPSPVRNLSVERRRPATQTTTAGRGKATLRSGSPMRATESPMRKRSPSESPMRKRSPSATRIAHQSPSTKKTGTPKRNLRVDTGVTNPTSRESRSPKNTTDNKNAPHYRRRETTEQQQHQQSQAYQDDGDDGVDEDSYLLYFPHNKIDPNSDSYEINRHMPLEPPSNRPDPEGPSASSRPDPDGNRCPSPPKRRMMRADTPLTNMDEIQGDPPPTPKVQPPTPTSRPANPDYDFSLEDRDDSNTGTLDSVQPEEEESLPVDLPSSPARKNAASSSPSPNTNNVTTRNTPSPSRNSRTAPSPSRRTPSPAKKQPVARRTTSSTRATTPLRGATATKQARPDTQKRKATTRKSFPQPSLKKSNSNGSVSTKRKQSRLPPLPSFRNSSPIPQQKVSHESPPRGEQSLASSTGDRQPKSHKETTSNESSKRPGAPTSPKKGASESPTNKGKTSPSEDTISPPPLTPSPKNSPGKKGPTSSKKKGATAKTTASPRNTVSQRNVGNKSSPSTPRNQKHTTPTAAIDRLHKGIPSPPKSTNTYSPRAATDRHAPKRPKESPRNTKPGTRPVRRYGRSHSHFAAVIQRHVRMMLQRQKFLRLRHCVIELQSAVRWRFQVQYARKGTRIQHFSSTVIQKRYRMISCRQSYLQLQYAVIIAQSAVRMFSCKSTYRELRSASRKLLGRTSVGKSKPPPTPKVQSMATVRGGRLRIYSALLIQSVVRMLWVRGAYQELRLSALAIQMWFRKIHVVIVKQRKAATVLQSRARMQSMRICFLDLRQSVILLQTWSRMVCARSRYLTALQFGLEHASASRIQSFYRRDICRSAYHQLRVSAIVLQHWIRGTAIRAAFLRLGQAALAIQCRTRQRTSERIVRELRGFVTIQSVFRSYLAIRVFIVKRACALMIQATIRGFLYRERFLSLKLAAIVVQSRRRVVLARAYVGIKRAAQWREATKLKRLRPNSPLPIRDRQEEIIGANAKARPDPIIIDISQDTSDDSADLVDSDAAQSTKQYDHVLSAALAFVSQSPSTVAPMKFKGPTPRVNRQPSPAPSRSAGEGQAKAAGIWPVPVKEESSKMPRNPRDPSPHFNISKNRLSRRKAEEPNGDNMSRQLAVFVQDEYDCPTPTTTNTSGRDPKSFFDKGSPPPQSSKQLKQEKQDRPSFSTGESMAPISSNELQVVLSPSAPSNRKATIDLGGSMLPMPPNQLQGPSPVPPTGVSLLDLRNSIPMMDSGESMTPLSSNQQQGLSPTQPAEVSQSVPCNRVPMIDLSESTAPMRSNQRQGPTPVLPARGSQAVSSNLITTSAGITSADIIARMSPLELSPSSQQQPYYFISNQSPEGSMGSPQLYALQPLNELPPPHTNNPRLYYVSNTQENHRHFLQEQQKTGLNLPYLEGMKRDRSKKRMMHIRQGSSKEEEFPPIPSLADNPSYYLPKEDLKQQTASTETETSEDSGASQLDSHDVSPPMNPLKKVMVQYRNMEDLAVPKLKKEDDCTEKAISEKLASIKQRSRARKVQRWTKRTLKREKTPPCQAYSDVKSDKRAVVDIAVEQWSKQTTRQKLAIITSRSEPEVVTQIQSAWRSHRDQLLLAGLILQTWGISCDFTPDIIGSDRGLRLHANALALDVALAQVGYQLPNGKTLVKNGLLMVQWERLVPIQLPGHDLQAEATYCHISVHCTANQSRFLVSWSEIKRCTLLVKAALAKYGGDQRQKLRRLSMFERSLIRQRADGQPNADHDTPITADYDARTPARQLAELRRGYDGKTDIDGEASKRYNERFSRRKAIVIQKAFRRFKIRKSEEEREHTYEAILRGVPDDFHQRLRDLSAIQIQSWYRMCACRSMFQGLRRITSSVLLQMDSSNEDIETINFYHRHKCETIVEEEGGFECTTGSSES